MWHVIKMSEKTLDIILKLIYNRFGPMLILHMMNKRFTICVEKVLNITAFMC